MPMKYSEVDFQSLLNGKQESNRDGVCQSNVYNMVVVMCHHPQMAGSPPLLRGQPDLDFALHRYKGVATEEREKRKLDNTTFLHNQVQKLAPD
uniref:Uncharacterized protein n=1 Tax=Physcomitrium patens TaxID=3218 RepID=A0A7I4FDN1_PHYPA